MGKGDILVQGSHIVLRKTETGKNPLGRLAQDEDDMGLGLAGGEEIKGSLLEIVLGAGFKPDLSLGGAVLEKGCVAFQTMLVVVGFGMEERGIRIDEVLRLFGDGATYLGVGVQPAKEGGAAAFASAS